IIFDEPVPLRRIQLRFHDTDSERTQEFTLRWSPAVGGPATKIVRQRWNFSPAGSTTEIEDYAVDLDAVSVLELSIQPDVTRREGVHRPRRGAATLDREAARRTQGAEGRFVLATSCARLTIRES